MAVKAVEVQILSRAPDQAVGCRLFYQQLIFWRNMNITNYRILYDKNDGLIIDDPRAFKACLILMREWGASNIIEPTGDNDIDKLLCEFADRTAELRTKHRVDGSLMDDKDAVPDGFISELVTLQDKYKVRLLASVIDLFDNEAIDLMLDIVKSRQLPAQTESSIY